MLIEAGLRNAVMLEPETRNPETTLAYVPKQDRPWNWMGARYSTTAPSFANTSIVSTTARSFFRPPATRWRRSVFSPGRWRMTRALWMRESMRPRTSSMICNWTGNGPRSSGRSIVGRRSGWLRRRRDHRLYRDRLPLVTWTAFRDDDWRKGRPALADWFDRFSKGPR